MTSLLINNGYFKSPLIIPRSKSFANRALILATLSTTSKIIQEVPESTDVTFLMKALRQIGVQIDSYDQHLEIKNSFPECESSNGQTIHVGEGGTTARFLSCLVLKGSRKYELILGERLKKRPWLSFITQMNKLGAKVSLEDNKLSLQGPLVLPASLEVDCSETTQFASGLQLSFPETKIIPTSLKSSQSYWDLTLGIMKAVEGSAVLTVPMDWSSASYPLAFAALNQHLSLPGLKYDPHQADAKFLSILKSFKAIETEDVDGINTRPGQGLGNQSLDVQDCLDLVPALAYFLAHIPGEHTLLNVANLIHKESNRLLEVIKLLAQFERKTEIRNQSLIIFGSTCKLEYARTLVLPDDHRMVMAGALFLLHHAGGEISPVEAVSKSYPGFFSQLVPKN